MKKIQFCNPVNVRLTREQMEAVDAAARVHGLSQAAAIRYLVSLGISVHREAYGLKGEDNGKEKS